MEEQYNCTLCGKVFPVQAKLLAHRRKYHINSVKTCRNLSSGTCKYGELKCWFNHNESEDKNENSENEDVIEKIFKFMEKLTQQMVDMKENNNLK